MALRSVSRLFQSLTLSCSAASSRTLMSKVSVIQSCRGLPHPHILSSFFNKMDIGNQVSSSNRNIHTSSTSLHPSVFKRWKKTPAYTITPIGMHRDGGRDPETGRRINRRGGGHQRKFRMIVNTKTPPEDGSVLEERVLGIKYDPNRSARIALVASGNSKKYVLATMNMKKGDIIRTCGAIGRMAVFANEGDSYRLGALPVGSLVHNVELFPGAGGIFVRAAGTCAQLVKKAGGQVILRLPSKRQISVSDQCMVSVGRLSNEEHNKRKLGKAGRKRWLGIRPKSGLFQRKGGRFGRKIKPLPPIKVYSESKL